MRRCPACFFVIENDNAKFCKKCGTKLLETPVQAAPKPAPKPAVETPKPAPKPVVETPKPAPKPAVETPKPSPKPITEKVKSERPANVPPPIPKHISSGRGFSNNYPSDSIPLGRGYGYGSTYNQDPERKRPSKKRNPIATCFRKYATFTGRAKRSEYWWFYIVYLLVFFAFWIPAIIIDRSPVSDILAGIGLFYWLIAWCPQFAVMVRRLHDVGKSGWFWMVTFIPLVGAFILLFFLCKKGDQGVNAYGPPEF